MLVDRFEKAHGSVDLRGSQVSTAQGFSQSSPEPFFARSSSVIESPQLRPNFSRNSPETQSLKEMNQILLEENTKLLKVVKKLQSKAEERKRNLKDVFKMLSSKENELRQLKAQVQVESSLYMIKFEEIFKLAEQKLKEKYLAVEKNLIQHENKLHNIEEEMSRLITYKGFTQGSSRQINDISADNFSPQAAGHEDPEPENLLSIFFLQQQKY